ncbi:hypothetical protein Tco_0600628 [Tanacetum coccineum]
MQITTPNLSTKEPDNSLSIGDEHLSTIPKTESDKIIKSSVEDLVLIPSESEGISDDTCDVPFCDNSPPLDVLNDYFEIFSDFNDDCTSSDDDYRHILREKLLNINLLIAKIESLNDNPTPDCVLKSPSPFPIPVEDSDSFFEKSDTSLSYSDNSLPEFETFSDHTEETTSGSTTTHADNSLPGYDLFHFEIESDQGELTSVVMEDILGEPFSFPSGTRNKIFDLGIFFEVQPKRFTSRDTFSISFICNPLCPVIETLLPFSSENEDQVFNLEILSSNLLSHLGKITSEFSESPMMICGEDIPILEVPYLYFYPLDQLKYGGSSQARDSVNKNKRFDCLDFEDSRARSIGYPQKDEKQSKKNKIREREWNEREKPKPEAEELAEYINSPSWNYPSFYDDDDEYTIQYKKYLENSSNAITPDLSTKEPDNSLSMGDEHLSTISETESDEVIKSSVEDLVPILSESEGISDDTCDVPFCDNSPPLDVFNDHFEIFSYVEASPPDSELVGLDKVKDFYPEDGENDTDILLKIKDDILLEKLLNINLLIAKIKSLNDNPTPDCMLKSPSPFPIPVEDSDSFFEKSDTSLSYSDNSLPEFETFSDHTEETRSGSTTTHADNSLPEYDSFHFEIEPDQGELTSVVMEDILGEPRVHVPNVLPTHPTLMLDSDFIPSDDSLGSDLEVSFPSGTRNKIFDPGIFFEVQSKRFLSRDTFSISFIRNPLCPVIETLLPFSSENEDKVFNPGILSSNLLSHRGKITSDFSESPMMISGGDIPFLDVPFLHFYPLDQLKLASSFLVFRVLWFLSTIAPDFEDSRACGFVHRPLDLYELQILSFILRIQYPNLID